MLADDVLSGAITLEAILSLIDTKEWRDWIVKMPPEDLERLKELKNTSPLASAALQTLQQRKLFPDVFPCLRTIADHSLIGADIFSAFAENETSQSKSVDIPSVVRSALKLSLVHIHKYRHVVLLTENKSLQSIAKSQSVRTLS